MRTTKICGQLEGSIWQEIQIEYKCDYTPYRPAPRCQDPNKSDYCDDGDQERLDIFEACLVMGERRIHISDPAFIAAIKEDVLEKIHRDIKEDLDPE